ncbi:MAG: sugar phosphate isomerase/epimerase [Planctomycetota bacterium]
MNTSREVAPFLLEDGGPYAWIRRAGFDTTDTSWDTALDSFLVEAPSARGVSGEAETQTPALNGGWYSRTVIRGERIHAAGLEAVSYRSDLLSSEFPPRANGAKQELHMQCARAAGCGLFLVHSRWVDFRPFDFSSDREWKESLDFDIANLLEVSARCDANGLRLVIENNPFFPSRYYAELLREIPAEKAGMCLDIGHANLQREGSGTALVDTIHALGGRIEHLHLHGNDGAKDMHLPILAPGGSVDWKECFRALKEVSYSGVVQEELTPTTPPDLVRWALADRGGRRIRDLWDSV